MADLIGQRLGNYEILSLLGEGGMAAVYRARQLNIKRDVAVKVIKHGLVSPDKVSEFVRRFEREAETIATLSHPHILKLFDYGQHEDLVYLVMELITGGSLAEKIQRGPFSPERTSRVLTQIASALDYAHEQGIVHRDLKPQNVLLDASANVILTDFGIAKLVKETTALTQSGMTMGTPAYMSPEQCQGRHIDARSDVYALGIMLFEMLTGRVPFQGDTPLSMALMHLQEAPPAIRELRADLPESVEQVLFKALAKGPDQRFQTAGELAAAFEVARTGKMPAGLAATVGSAPEFATSSVPAVAPRPASQPRVPAVPEPPPPRRRSAALGIGAVAVLAVIGLIVLVLSSRGDGAATATPTPTATTPQIAGVAPTSTPKDTLPASATPEVIAIIPTGRPTTTATPSFTVSATPSSTLTFTATASRTASPSRTASSGRESTLVLSATETPTPPPSFMPSITSTEVANVETVIAQTLVVRETNTAAAVASFTRTATPTFTPSLTPSPTHDLAQTAAVLLGATDTAVAMASWTKTPTPSSTATPSLTATHTPTATSTATASNTPTTTPTATPSLTRTLTPTYTASRTATNTPSGTPTPTATLSVTPTSRSISGSPCPGRSVVIGDTLVGIAQSFGVETTAVLDASSMLPVEGLLRPGQQVIIAVPGCDTARAAIVSAPTSELAESLTSTPVRVADASAIVAVVTRNADWTPIIQSFDGVEMVLVPPGCFTMGSNDGDPAERPAHIVCIDRPFWLDRFEVSNAQFSRHGGAAVFGSTWTELDRPREHIFWFEAHDFCALRDARLPTEAEWEYAARGPDGLIYPWGNEFDGSYAIYRGNSSEHTGSIGRRTGGASWVGAVDMTGNVAEFTSSEYRIYPYNGRDGRETPLDRQPRAVRGGSWDSFAQEMPLYHRAGFNQSDYAVGFRCARSIPCEYTVQVGDSLAGIAQSMQVSIEALAAANDMGESRLVPVGQVIVNPTCASLATPATSVTPATPTIESTATNDACQYTVQPGDTFANIAWLLGVTMDALAAANEMGDTRLVQVGQVLINPACAPPARSTATPAIATPVAMLPETSSPVARNADWTPVVQSLGGVEMVLVPPGCFMMGSNDGDQDTEPAHEVCFDRSFWLDRTEVTNEQYSGFGGMAARESSWTEADRPRENITWFEARDFCELRGGRLPTEAEWEYAARGPDDLVYPWGGAFNREALNFCDVNCSAVTKDFVANDGYVNTAPVGSYGGGISWIGALDLSGNVAEWTNSLYHPYPYDGHDGREADTADRTDVYRVVRGGSWSRTRIGVQSANRARVAPNQVDESVGFRCARSDDENLSLTAPAIPRPPSVSIEQLTASVASPVTRNADWTPVMQSFDGVEMVQVPAGCFMMGNASGRGDERPVHEVCFSQPFWMDHYEVSNRQFEQHGGWAIRASTWTGANRPRDQVTWTEARDFCALREARLPTEAEWEYSARGPDGLIYPWGRTFVSDNVVYGGNSGMQTWNVGAQPGDLSWVGARDMSGNLREWVADWYGGYGSAPLDDPQGPTNGTNRILRGGSWADVESNTRATYRNGGQPDGTGDVIGFRCARDYAAPASPSASESATSTPSTVPQAIINLTSVNLRAAPGTNYARLASAAQGQSFAVIGRTAASDWYQISLPDGQAAWVSAALVQLSPVNAQIPIAAAGAQVVPAGVATSAGNITIRLTNAYVEVHTCTRCFSPIFIEIEVSGTDLALPEWQAWVDLYAEDEPTLSFYTVFTSPDAAWPLAGQHSLRSGQSSCPPRTTTTYNRLRVRLTDPGPTTVYAEGVFPISLVCPQTWFD